MEFIIERDAIIKSLSKVQGIVEKRNAMPILSNTLLRAKDDKIEVIATDLEVTVMDNCPVNLHKPGVLTLNAKKLYDIVRELPEGPVSLISGDDFHVEVKSGKVRFELLGMSPDDYPKIPEPSKFKFIKIKAKMLLEMIQKTIYASAGEEARYSLNGIYLEKTKNNDGIIMVATDGHRLAKLERKVEGIETIDLPAGVILPRKGMAEVAKLIAEVEEDVGFAIQEKMAALTINDTVVVMRLVDGKFPDYNRVIEIETDKTASINKEELVRNLRRVSIMVDEKARAVKFSFAKKLLSLESRNPNFGSSYSEMEIDYDHETVAIGFNDRYFVDIIANTKSDNIQVELKDSQSPAIVKVADDEQYVCIVMPMRL